MKQAANYSLVKVEIVSIFFLMGRILQITDGESG